VELLRKPNGKKGVMSGNGSRNVCLQVVTAVLLTAVLTLSLQLGAARGEGDAPGAQEAPGAPRTELPALRTATSNTYSLPSGDLQTELFSSPVNYETDAGDWKPIDEGLEESPGGEITNGANSFGLHLPEEMGEDPVRLAEDGHWVSYRYLGPATEAAEIEGSTATYEAPSGDLSFELQSLSDGMKENIVLGSPSQPSEYRFALDLSTDLTPELLEDGSIAIRDEGGRVFAALPAPTVSDASGLSGPAGAAHYSLEPAAEGTWLLSVAIGEEWLSDPSRQFPVTLDPTIKVLNPTLDCDLGKNASSQGWHECGTTGAKELLAAYSQKEKWPVRTLLKFPVSGGTERTPGGLTSNSYIKKAVLGLYAPAAAENTTALETRRVTRDWTSALNWETPIGDTHTFWTTPGGDFNSEGLAEVQTSKRGSQAGWWEFESESLRKLVAGWAAGTIPNQGLIVKQNNETRTAECESSGNCPRRYVAFRSSTASAETRPKLTLTYYNRAPDSSKVTLPSEGTVTARRLKLKAAWSEAGVTGVSFLFREGDKGPFELIPANLVRDANNQSVTWPVAVSGVKQTQTLYFDAAHATSTLTKKGGTIQIRALFDTLGTKDGVSEPVEARVDRELGGAGDETAAVGPGAVDLLTGNFSLSRSDVSIPAYNMSLTFSRSFNSRGVNLSKTLEEGAHESSYEQEMKKALGPGWGPSGSVETGGSPWGTIRMVEETETYEEENENGELVTFTYTYAYALLKSIDGVEYSFEKQVTPRRFIEKEGKLVEEPERIAFITPPELNGYGLTQDSSGQFVLATPGGEKTTFAASGGSEYAPVSVSQSSGAGKTRLIYDVVNGRRRLNTVVAPAPPGINCEEAPLTTTGCKSLKFNYTSYAFGNRLTGITYFYGGHEGTEVAKYAYNSEGFLSEAWDPRISPALKETYTYTSTGQLKTITPPGQQPWTLEYGFADGEEGSGRLIAVKRPTLLASPATAQTTIAYQVPVGVLGPYNLSKSKVAEWGQQDIPLDATAIFPPTEIPASPPSSYTKATVYYMDAEGMAVNIATPAGAGTESASISTMETDEFGNVVRELTPQNRLRALEAPASAERAAELDTHRTYSEDGSRMLEEWGPLHPVALEGGGTAQARLHRVVVYDQNAPGGYSTGNPDPNLPTTEVTGASISGQGVDVDQRTTKIAYDWKLLQPTEVIEDPKTEGNPEGLNIQKSTVYDPATGLPVERRQPSDPTGRGAGTMKTIYYSVNGSTGCSSRDYAGLPCKVMPVAQPKAEGLPELPTKQFLSYNQFSQPLVVTETVGPAPGHEEPTSLRTKRFTYDAAGRQTSMKIEGGGAAISKVEKVYSSTLGLPTVERFVCDEANCTGFDTQAITSTYDSLGRLTSYEDADGNKATTAYDLMSRPVSVTDGKGSQAFKYDTNTGLLIELEDSAAGKFTGSYDADGNLVKRSLPDGLTAETSFDATGAPVHLTYTKSSSCGVSCTWLDFGLERSVGGQILAESGTLGTEHYAYDKAGRLVSAQETPAGGSCTTRTYNYDVDSNRTGLTTSPGVGGACSGSGGTSLGYKYDEADRLESSGLTYDELGRITTLPAALAGGSTLTTSYFSNDMVASQSQNGVTNTFQLDAGLRQRSRLQGGGGLEGIEIFHYDDATDSPSWTERGSTWTRNIVGIGGELVAVQESGKEVTLLLTNLHGDVSATAAVNPVVTNLKGTFRYDEFGNPVSGNPGRFGWLGQAGRRTELPSGVIQMGARSYVAMIGRFLSTDPVQGGSASPYNYAGSDPVNSVDISGLSPIVLPGTPLHVGTCWIYTVFNETWYIDSGAHELAASPNAECHMGSTLIMSLQVAQKFHTPPVVYRNVTFLSFPPIIGVYQAWTLYPHRLCIDVYWHAEDTGDLKHKHKCTAWDDTPDNVRGL
jgi:RHS repeat-associated protein